MDPEGYDEKYKKWSMETLPMLPKNMKLTVLKKTGKQYNEVKKQLLRNDVSDIIVATDAGREGELVAYWILEKARVNKPVKRLWISSQTEKAILEGFKNLKPGKEFENLRKAAVCRAEADWLVGLNVTRALTCKYNAQLSAGRVQSPTLAMIVNREEEIKNFKPVDYFNIKALGKGITLAWASDKGTIYEEDLAKSIVNKCKGQEGEVVEIIKSNKKKYSQALYDLTELQRDANKIWGYSAKQTLNIMQRLYENHKVLTYPRTDSRYITSDIVSTIPERLKAVSFGEYRAVSEMLLKSGVKANKNFVDNSKVSDHHAIIPTEQKGNLVNLSVEEKHIYDLVVKRFLSVMMKPYEYEQTSIKVNVNGEIFTAKGNIPKQKGWKVLYEKLDLDEEEKTQDLPQLNKGDKIKLLDVSYIKKQTAPPARFNEATLLSAMENPQKYVNVGKDAAKTLGETGGLGTVATRADIIEKLFNSFVIEKKGKDIYPTSKGKQLIELVPKDLKSPLLTAKWEKQLDDIAKGKINDNKFIKDMREYATNLVEDVKGGTEKFHHDNQTGSRCPNCGKYLLEVNGKNGRMLVCQDRECGYRENLARLTNARCPECHKKLELRGQGEGKIYVCVGENCNFREKASVFEKRFDKKGKVNKKEVKNIMKKMQKEAEDFNENPFAKLFGKIE